MRENQIISGWGMEGELCRGNKPTIHNILIILNYFAYQYEWCGCDIQHKPRIGCLLSRGSSGTARENR